ncbi:MAG: ribonuclease PH [Gemmatimonadales bacterium]|nr:MAG: ribonuclease PH [Gemmatimonadales bacterium]
MGLSGAQDKEHRRADGRRPEDLRSVVVEADASPYAEGSCLIAFGSTRVLCTASVQEGVPAWREASGHGWITAEYGMLPRSTHSRRGRERGGVGGRTQEIQRLIGRTLRAGADLERLGPRTVVIDADVLQADGGTRTAAVTGGWIALALAVRSLTRRGVLGASPLREPLAAVSVGVLDDRPLLDLDYSEDSRAEMDMNVVATGDGRIVEVQGTAEGLPVHRSSFQEMLDLALAGIESLVQVQREFLEAR